MVLFSSLRWANWKGVLLLFTSICLACNHATPKAGSPGIKLSDGQKKMLQLIAETRTKINTPQNIFAPEAKLAQCDSILNTSRNDNELLNTAVKKATTLSEYGDEGQAVALLEKIKSAIGDSKEARKVVLLQLGIAYLRLAERNNCVMGYNDESCLMPIQGKGIHRNKTGAQKATETFEELLKEDPENYSAIWLLNIAYMTLGEYPQQVPKQWLVPDLYAPGYPLLPFAEMAGDLKIMVNNRSGGSIVEDFNNDGYLDIVTSAWDLSDPMHFFKNNGEGTFSDESEKSGLKMITGGLNIQQTDYNNDGNPDIFVLRGAWQGQAGIFGEQPNSLLRNNGDGTFTDVTIEAGLLSFCPTQTASWNDFNRDGWLDVFIGNESVPGNKSYPCEFYINNGDGTFRNVSKEWNVNVQLFVKGVASGDYDNDGWPDIFLSTMDGHKMLLHNKGLVNGKVDFEDVTAASGLLAETYHSFPTFFFDYDNDGWLDLLISNYEFDKPLSYYAAKEVLHPSDDKTGKVFIYHNNHKGGFVNVSKSMGLKQICFTMGSNFGDVNNDGWLDFYLGTGNPSYQSLVPNRLYVNVEGQKFAEATNSSRTGTLQKGHGVSFADIDNDGDQDIHTDLGGAFRGDGFPSALYVNPGQNNNRWIYLKLEGTKSNKVGVGANITVKFHENGKARMVYREVNSGGSFGCSPYRREIGVGQTDVIDEITVNWPASGITQTLNNVKPNQYLKIVEGKDGFETLPLNKIVFKRADGTIPMCAPTK